MNNNNLHILERIPEKTWIASHLSMARFYGGCKINGKVYILDRETNDLVREDVWKQDQKLKSKPNEEDKQESLL